MSDASVENVAMWGKTRALFESTDEAVQLHAREFSQRAQGWRCIQVCGYIVEHSVQPCLGQPAFRLGSMAGRTVEGEPGEQGRPEMFGVCLFEDATGPHVVGERQRDMRNYRIVESHQRAEHGSLAAPSQDGFAELRPNLEEQYLVRQITGRMLNAGRYEDGPMMTEPMRTPRTVFDAYITLHVVGEVDRQKVVQETKVG